MLKKARILVVEDDMIICEDIRISLQTIGYKLAGIFESGEETLEQIKLLKPDLVLMDIVLRGRMNGIETARKIRDQYDIPVVFLTAYADKITLERAKKTKPYGYIFKPFDDLELKAVIGEALKKYQAKKTVPSRKK